MFAARARKCFVVMLAVTVGGLACFTAFSYLPALAVQKHRARAQLHATTQAPPPDATQSDFDNDSATATLPSYGDSSSSAQHDLAVAEDGPPGSQQWPDTGATEDYTSSSSSVEWSDTTTVVNGSSTSFERPVVGTDDYAEYASSVSLDYTDVATVVNGSSASHELSVAGTADYAAYYDSPTDVRWGHTPVNKSSASYEERPDSGSAEYAEYGSSASVQAPSPDTTTVMTGTSAAVLGRPATGSASAAEASSRQQWSDDSGSAEYSSSAILELPETATAVKPAASASVGRPSVGTVAAVGTGSHRQQWSDDSGSAEYTSSAATLELPADTVVAPVNRINGTFGRPEWSDGTTDTSESTSLEQWPGTATSVANNGTSSSSASVEQTAAGTTGSSTGSSTGSAEADVGECGGRACPGEDPDPAVRARRDAVRAMMRHAWDGYARSAWGRNELRPISRTANTMGIFGDAPLAASLVDGLDTLHVMGMMDEFEEGRDWVARHLHPADVDRDVSVFETNIRLVGGLLSCFALTGDAMFRDKAREVAERLLPAFDTPTGVPRALVNLKTGHSSNYRRVSGGNSILSEVGTLHLEFKYLSDVTGDDVFSDKVDAVRRLLRAMEKPRGGLYPNYLSPLSGTWGEQHVSIGAGGDSFYEYLLKSWLQSERRDAQARDMFDAALDSMFTHLYKTSPGGLSYFADLHYDYVEDKMEHLACFSGGLLALAAQTRPDDQQRADRYREAAAALTHTCHESYDRSAVKLGPEVFRFAEGAEATASRPTERMYQLRPEVVESYFVLWRTTGDPKYREWGWQAVQALEAHCKVPGGGYAGVRDVYDEDPRNKDDVQQSFFLAETLKYLYLLFSDRAYFPLDEWVFNTEAHPLPIRGTPHYRGVGAEGKDV